MNIITEARATPAVARLFLGLTSIVVWLSASGAAPAFTTLKSFGSLTNITGGSPRCQLVRGADGTLYGTTSDGEGNVRGTVFKVQPDGSGFTVLKWFTNSVEGALPFAGVTLSGNVLYGTTWSGGSSNFGTVFKVNTDGTGFTVLRNLGGLPDFGGQPRTALTVSGSVIYGTEGRGVFRLNTDGSDYLVLKPLIELGDRNPPIPDGKVTLSGDVLYGTTRGGGFRLGYGTVFKVNTDGTGFVVLREFIGSDGEFPAAGLTLSAGVLYGTTRSGGSSGSGTVFKVNLDGSRSRMRRESI